MSIDNSDHHSRLSRAISQSSTFSDGDDTLTPLYSPPNLSRLYEDAAEFEKVLLQTGCIDRSTPDISKTGPSGFSHLISQDLTCSEQIVASRIPKLNATRLSFTASDGVASEDGQNTSPDVSNKDASFPIIHRVQTEDEDTWKLEPGKVIDLLIEEFGPLTDGDDEKLVLEADGCLFSEVLIVGVIHITTHRLAFHASLFASQPDLPLSQRIIKSGPAVLHRKGWRTKRRVWMELSYDMVCTYASSSDEDRIRPLRSVLLAFINKLLPLDQQEPRYLRIELTPQKIIDVIEFDTEESALDWRKELNGALFLYRHHRRQSLKATTPDEESGVRLSFPLNRIAHVHFGNYPNFPSIASLHIQPVPSEEYHSENNTMEPQIIHLGTVTKNPLWSHLDKYIITASHRFKERPIEQSPIFVDFGPLDFHETRSPSEGDILPRKEMSIRGALSLKFNELGLWITRARIYRNITSSGYLVVSQYFVYFWSKGLIPGDIKYRIPVVRINSLKSFHLIFCRLYGIALDIRGEPSLKLVFWNITTRDEAMEKISTVMKISELALSSSVSPGSVSKSPRRSASGIFSPLSRSLAAAAATGLPTSVQLTMPKAINLPREVLARLAPMHFVCLTIGSRGDVQPYIALGLGLKKEGHHVTIVTHEEYKDWIIGFGIGHRTAGGDPGALMKLSVENKMFSPDFFRESLTHFRPWLDQLLLDAWEACQDADVLLESPSAMAGVHIAEALNIPYFRTFTMPWTKTTEFPHAFLSPPVESPTFNSASYILFSNVMWAATSGQINRWRRHSLKLSNTDMGHLAQSKIITIYNFSQAVVPRPLDWGDTTTISGYWFLDNPDLDWSPPHELLEWMAKARADGKPIVYIGFGSITVPHPNRVTARIVRAVVQSDVRAIISKGWSSRMRSADEKDAMDVEMPPQCYMVEKIPHDWLFSRIDAALHHGGAGTTGASLRAGIPTLIKPWFGDQFFWSARVQKLGAGLRVPSLRVSDLSDALVKATTSISMREKAASVGEKIRSEEGVHTAIYTIYTYLPRASRDRTSS